MGDYSFSGIKGNYSFNCPDGCVGPTGYTGKLSNDYSWAVGGRIGFVALPGLLTYFNGGYTQGHFKGVNYLDGATAGSLVLHRIVKLGTAGSSAAAPNIRSHQIWGLFWKNEVRFSEFDNKTAANVCLVAGTCGAAGTIHSLDTSKVFVQAATTELVYRFNWGGRSPPGTDRCLPSRSKVPALAGAFFAFELTVASAWREPPTRCPGCAFSSIPPALHNGTGDVPVELQARAKPPISYARRVRRQR